MMQYVLNWWTWYEAHRSGVQFGALVALTLFIGHITLSVIKSTVHDHGFPGRRKPNSNGRFRLDRSVAWLFVSLMLLLLARLWVRWPDLQDQGLAMDASTVAMIHMAARAVMVLRAMMDERKVDNSHGEGDHGAS